MGFKCAIQFTGLTMGEPKPKKNGGKPKHRADGRHIMGEMGNERWSRSETIDRTRSHENVYYQEQESGIEVWEEMCERANNHKRKVEKYIKKTGETKVVEVGVRKDAVIAVACIINPPEEVCKDWSQTEYDKFYVDTIEALYDFKKSDGTQLFRDENCRFVVEHRDEGMTEGSYHVHMVYDAIDEDGNYSLGNTLDSKWLTEFNEYYPQFMRERDWDMDDYDKVDWERYNNDEKYRCENEDRVNKRGLSVNDYRALKISEKMSKVDEVHKEMSNMLSEAKELSSDKETLKTEVEELRKDVESKQKTKETLEKSMSLDTLREEKKTLEAQKTALEASVTALTVQKQDLSTKVSKMQSEASESLEEYKKEADEYAKEVNKSISDHYKTEYQNNFSQETVNKVLTMFNYMRKAKEPVKYGSAQVSLPAILKHVAGKVGWNVDEVPRPVAPPKVREFKLPQTEVKEKENEGQDFQKF